MRNCKFLTLAILCCTVWGQGCSQDFRNSTMYQYACAEQTDVPPGVVFTEGPSLIACGKMLLDSTSSNTMLVMNGPDGSVMSGFATDIQETAPCEDSDSVVKIYSTGNQPKRCPDSCGNHYQLLGQNYCLHGVNSALTYAQHIHNCISMGGELAELEALAHLHATYYSFPVPYIFLGATDFDVRNTFKWNRGDLVDRSLFHQDEPSRSDERCIAIQPKGELNQPLLIDVECEFATKGMCAVRCD